MAVDLLYFSATGNTSNIAKAIAGPLGEVSAEYDITPPRARDGVYSFEEEDLVIIGVPVYAGRIPKFLLPVLNRMNGRGAYAVCIVTYGNRDYEDALLELSDICEERGFHVVAAGAFVGEHSYTDKLAKGRPGNADIQIAQDFALEIKEKMTEGLEEGFKISGNFPYVQKALNPAVYGPVTSDSCTACGLCERRCPMGVIDAEDFKKIYEEDCIHCCSCIKCCPVSAKSFPQPEFKQLTDWLETNFVLPDKQPELFL